MKEEQTPHEENSALLMEVAKKLNAMEKGTDWTRCNCVEPEKFSAKKSGEFKSEKKTVKVKHKDRNSILIAFLVLFFPMVISTHVVDHSIHFVDQFLELINKMK